VCAMGQVDSRELPKAEEETRQEDASGGDAGEFGVHVRSFVRMHSS